MLLSTSGPLPWLEDQGYTSPMQRMQTIRQAGTLGIPQPAPPWALEVQETKDQEATSLGKEKHVKGNIRVAEGSRAHIVISIALESDRP